MIPKKNNSPIIWWDFNRFVDCSIVLPMPVADMHEQYNKSQLFDNWIKHNIATFLLCVFLFNYGRVIKSKIKYNSNGLLLDQLIKYKHYIVTTLQHNELSIFDGSSRELFNWIKLLNGIVSFLRIVWHEHFQLIGNQNNPLVKT